MRGVWLPEVKSQMKIYYLIPAQEMELPVATSSRGSNDTFVITDLWIGSIHKFYDGLIHSGSISCFLVPSN